MITIIEEILGITMGQTAYDDYIVTGAILLGFTSILLIISVFKKFLNM